MDPAEFYRRQRGILQKCGRRIVAQGTGHRLRPHGGESYGGHVGTQSYAIV